ncbi:MAG: HNH endonuclease [Bradymonadales bacterium]|nr:MAG: HNH endonuclease [Bradymonadales bacterium]
MGLTAHQNPWASREKALKIALKLALQEVEKRKLGVRGKKKGAKSRNTTKDGSQAGPEGRALREAESLPGADAAVEVKAKPLGAEETGGVEFQDRERHRKRRATLMEVATATEAVSPEERKEVKIQPKNNRSRHIPTAVRAEVWERDGGACVFVEPGSGRSCGSTFGLEWDHILEFSRGGESSEANLRLLCRQHNNGRQRWERQI